MVRQKRAIKVYLDDQNRPFMWVYRGKQWKCYHKTLSQCRLYLIARLVDRGRFIVRPYTGDGVGFTAKEV